MFVIEWDYSADLTQLTVLEMDESTDAENVFKEF